MTAVWALAALWVGLALIASLIAIYFRISIALSEIIVGALAADPWHGAGFGSPLANLLMDNFKTAVSVGVWETFVVLGLIYFIYMMSGRLATGCRQRDGARTALRRRSNKTA